MPDLLLEIGTEELPPHDIAPALEQLAEGTRAAFAALRIDAGPLRTYGAPRRLALVCTGVASRQRPMVREVRGPAARAAFDAEGHPTQAAIGFARGQGIPVERLQTREVEGKAYARVLKSCGVIVDSGERRRVIVVQATTLAKQVAGMPVLDPLLLHELVMGTEHPQVLRGAFDREFLALPGPVLVTVMQHHQKYFAVEDGRRQLLPYFLAVRDGDDRHLATVRQGHEWVLRARLADARFFFQEDRRRRLEDYLPALDGLLYQAQLGTMAEKTRRLVTLSRHVSGLLLLDR